MCVISASGSRDCFPIDVGHNHPPDNDLSKVGTGQLSSEIGAKYTTQPGDGSASLSQKNDGDACDPGIGGDYGSGKWIHKAHYNGKCQATGSYMTAGCMAVSCSDWPVVKAACNAHAHIHVCQEPGAIPTSNNRYNPAFYSSAYNSISSTAVSGLSGGSGSSSGTTVPYNSKRGTQ
jgi:hypothetical protein